jgi:hypothetical protein
MKKAILVFLSVVGVFTAQAQSTFTTMADTARGIADGDGFINFHNDITPTNGPIKINWKVKSINNLPNTWYNSINNFGICDNNNCYLYVNDGSPVDADVHKTSFINTGITEAQKASRTFKIQIDAGDYPAGGPYYITATLTDTNDATSTKDVVFAFSKWPTSVSSVNQNTDDVSIYPNPAKGDINVVFNGNAGIKNISVYNLIGKVVSVYKVNGNSAKLDLSNMPSGIYFMRLVDNTGRIVATRKFTHQ